MILLMEEILHQLRLVVYPIVYRVLYIPGGAGFLPSTVILPTLSKGKKSMTPDFFLGWGMLKVKYHDQFVKSGFGSLLVVKVSSI